ncbi:hypothetical protein M422DRAFT_209005 [Sphaerobolus stellatus SS14]|uniref:Uncharacterized protein n=1 Tax=Sphaerobolus stellatus (strain SS14) TaxID=990650 RepID=A0A0C9UGG8_SPHS4|nr:hypothetical protein M422DRAFT_209005 [Sphaerobolus stellatus SS14]
MAGFTNSTLIVPRGSSNLNPYDIKISESQIPESIPNNHVVIRVERFGFSANNVTYQAFGEHPHFRYFEFHYSPEALDKYGVIPVWGYGTVVASTVGTISTGERVFGYFGMSKYLLLPIDTLDLNAHNFYVVRSHLTKDRRPYNQITRCAADPLYKEATEDLAMIYRPLFWTAFWCEDWLFSGTKVPFSGASTILISSASSKTAFCFAHLLGRRRISLQGTSIRIIGLTSKKNRDFTQSLQLYDQVITYDEVTKKQLPTGDGKWVYVDLTANEAINSKVVNVLGPILVRYVNLGVTSVAPNSDRKNAALGGSLGITSSSPRDGSTPEMFFMPEWLSERRKLLTVKQIAAMQYHAWTELMGQCGPWIRVKRTWGTKKVAEEYRELAENGVGPENGLIWSLWNEGDIAKNSASAKTIPSKL